MCVVVLHSQVHERLQTIKAMTLYICHVTHKAWKALVLFYWQSVAERQKRKLIKLQNLRYRSDAMFPKVQKSLKKPAGFKNHTLVDQKTPLTQSADDTFITNPDLLTVDMISSDEEEGEGEEDTSIEHAGVYAPHVIFQSL